MLNWGDALHQVQVQGRVLDHTVATTRVLPWRLNDTLWQTILIKWRYYNILEVVGQLKRTNRPKAPVQYAVLQPHCAEYWGRGRKRSA